MNTAALTPDAIQRAVAELSEIPGPSGHEAAVRAQVIKGWSKRGLDCTTDQVGNVLAHAGGSGPRVLLVGHMDEIGYVVRSITSDGFLLVTTAQGSPRSRQDRRFMVSHPVSVFGRAGVVASGIFAAAAGHALNQEQLDSIGLTIDDFFVDIGADSADAAYELGIVVGSPIVFDVRARVLGTRIVGKALDDRLMLAVTNLLLDSFDRNTLTTIDLWLAATVQEENGANGASALATQERFDAVIALDIGLAGDVPTLEDDQLSTRLGSGATVVHQDEHIAYDRTLTWALVDAAKAADAPVQHATFGNYGSDGLSFIQSGMRTALLGVPVRYTHTAAEMAETSDIRAAVAVIQSFLTAPPTWST